MRSNNCLVANRTMSSTVEAFSDSRALPSVVGTIHRPARPSRDALVLTHGAGSDHNAPLLVSLATALAETGVTVLRCDLPFRQQRRSGPPRGDGSEDRAGLERAIELFRATSAKRIFLGGQSYGGRQASMLVANIPHFADGLLLLSYPLHAPGRPDQLRTKHLPNIHLPTLFVSGSKDPFVTPHELKTAIKLLPARTSFLSIDGAGHDLGFGKRASKRFQSVPTQIAEAFSKFFSQS